MSFTRRYGPALICATIALIVGGGAMWSQFQHRAAQAQHAALADALEIIEGVETRLELVRVALSTIDLEQVAPQSTLPVIGALWSETNVLWWSQGGLIESVGEDELVEAWFKRRTDIVAHPIVAPVPSDHARAAIVVQSARPGGGWVAVSFPTVLVLPTLTTKSISHASVRLVRSAGKSSSRADAVIFSVAATSRPRGYDVPFEVAGESWRLEFDDNFHSNILSDQAPLGLLVLLLAHVAAVTVLQIQERTGRSGAALESLTLRFNRLNDQYVGALAGQESVQERIAQLSTLEAESGLLNRAGFRFNTDRMLALAREKGAGAAVSVICIKLDDLERAVLVMGRGILNSLLPMFVGRLKNVVPEKSIVARTATYEFAIAVPDCDADAAAILTSSLPVGKLAGLYTHDDGDFNLSPRAGVATSADSFTSSDRLLDDAVTAVDAARQRRTLWATFDESQRNKRVTAIQLQSDFRRALDNNEFRLHYQPIISTYERKPCGFECLIRWEHPVDGLLSPDKFVPMAERQGLIGELTLWVLREAVKQASQWDHLAQHGAYLSVNLAASDLGNPKLVGHIDSLLRESGLPPSVLRLEVTETMLIDDITASRETITAMRGAGLAVMMDDFGSGYSSLSCLRELPFNSIKIDASLTHGIAVDSKRYGMLKSIISLIQYLEMDTVIEGVETEDEFDLLRPLNPGFCQGYFFARPMPAVDAEEYLAGFTMAMQA